MAISIAAVAVLVLSAAGSEPPALVPGSVEVQRLVHLGQLWSTVKTFHPALFTTDLDWDAALIEAEPRVRSARTKEEYAAALEAMLARLGDPVCTHLVWEPAKPVKEVPPRKEAVRWADGKVLVLSLIGIPWSKEREVETQAKKLLPLARAVVVDLRDDNASEAQLFFLRDEIGGLHAAGAPRMVYLEHRGYRPQVGSTWGGYGSYLIAREPDTLRPRPGRPAIPVTFVVRPSIGMLPTVLAFQAAGNGRIVSDGPLTEEAVVVQQSVELGEGLSALVRGAVLDGGFPGADLVADPAKAVDEAIRLSGTGMPRARSRSPNHRGTGSWKPDKTYADTPYPTEPLRVLAGLRLWSVVQWFYPYRHLLTEDWDQVLAMFLPRLIGARNAEEYAFTLAEMSTHIADGHTGVRGFASLDAVVGRAQAPVTVRLIEGKYLITQILEAEAASGVRVGDEITAVGGQPVSARVAQLGPLLAASTLEAHRHRIAGVLLTGPEGSTATVDLVGADGERRSATLKRSERYWGQKPSGPSFKVLATNIGYIDLRVLTPDGVAAAMQGVRSTRALIIDLRCYPNGVFPMLGRFLNQRQAKVAALIYEPRISAEEPTGLFSFEQGLGAPAGWTYGGPVVTLLDERARSQSEHTALWIEAAHGTTFIGSPTAGANGDVTVATLPGGGSLSFTGHDIRHADGRQLQRVGIVPDVEARPTVAGIRAGRDEVLEVAVKWIDAHVK
jgi:C-terminal processing protease CtpA/Prc